MIKIGKIFVQNNVVLHDISNKYIDDLYEMLSDEDTARYIISKTHSSICDTESFFNKIKIQQEEEKSIYLGIFIAQEDKLIGFIALHRFDYLNRKLKIGYALNIKYQKKEIMKKSLDKVVDYIFKNTGFIRVEATVNVDNINSYKLLESCQFTREGLLRKYSYNERSGEIEDRFIYSKIKGEKDNV